MSLIQELMGFTGTEQYHATTFGKLKVTDGIHYLREKANCYWLIDIVESYQDKLKNVPFQLWRIEVHKDKSFTVTCREDTNTPNLVKQEAEYTDFPLDQFEFYCVQGVVMLKGEY